MKSRRPPPRVCPESFQDSLSAPQPQEQLRQRKRDTRARVTARAAIRPGSQFASSATFLGFLVLFIGIYTHHTAVGLIGVSLSVLGELARRRRCICWQCGNNVTRSARVCPTCGASFTGATREISAADRNPWASSLGYLFVAFFCVILAGVVVYWMIVVGR